MAGLFSGTASRALSVAVTDYQNQLDAGRAINAGLHTADRQQREIGLMSPAAKHTNMPGAPYTPTSPYSPGDPNQFKVGSTYSPSVGVQPKPAAAPTAAPGVVPPGGPAAPAAPAAQPPANTMTASNGMPGAVPTDANGVPRPTLEQWKLMNPETKQTILDIANRSRKPRKVMSARGREAVIGGSKLMTMQEFEKTLDPGVPASAANAYRQRGAANTPTAGLQTPAAAGNQYQSIIDEASRTYGVNPSLLTRMASQESGFDPNATSPKGAGGIMQLMPGTAADLQVGDVHDPQQNIMGGANYISQMLKKYNGDEQLALMAYNWGPGNVDNWIANGRDPQKIPEETANYVEKITGVPPMKDSAAPLGASNDKRVRFAVSQSPAQYDFASKQLMQERESHIATLQQTYQMLQQRQQQADQNYATATASFNAAKAAGDYEGMKAAMEQVNAANSMTDDANARIVEFTSTAQKGINEYNDALVKLESDRAVRELASGNPARAAMLYSSLSGEQRRYEPSADGTFVAIDGSGSYVLEPGTGHAKKYSVVDIAYDIYGVADKQRAAAIDAGNASQAAAVNESAIRINEKAAEHTFKMDEKAVELRQALATAQINGEYDIKQKLMEMDRDIQSVQKMDDGSLYVFYKGQQGKVVKISPNAVQTIGDGTQIPANEITVEYTGGVNTSGAPVN